jgi:Glycosyl transferase family 2
MILCRRSSAARTSSSRKARSAQSAALAAARRLPLSQREISCTLSLPATRPKVLARRMVEPTSPKPTFSVVIPTSGRRTAIRALASVVPQLEDGDEVLLIRSDAGDWGDSARNSAMERARGTHLLFLDDDDVHTPRALAIIRDFAREHPGRIGIFRMRYEQPLHKYGQIRWTDPELRWANVGTPMFVVPNLEGKLGRWDSAGYTGDWDFIRETVSLQGEPIFRNEVVARLQPLRAWVVPWAIVRPWLLAIPGALAVRGLVRKALSRS